MAQSTESEIEEKWALQQHDLSSQVVVEDVEQWQHSRSLRYVAGVDVSFVKGSDTVACAALTVCEIPHLNVVYKDVFMTQVTVDYIPGFLAFREAAPLIEAIKRLKEKAAQYCTVVLVDGNGILHPRKSGVATHIGVACDIPAIGVAKNLFQMSGFSNDEQHKSNIAQLKVIGDSFPLQDDQKCLLGIALKTSQKAVNPVYVSVGHKISLETAKWVVLQSCIHRVPEPIRQADICSREFLRDDTPFQSILKYNRMERLQKMTLTSSGFTLGILPIINQFIGNELRILTVEFDGLMEEEEVVVQKFDEYLGKKGKCVIKLSVF